MQTISIIFIIVRKKVHAIFGWRVYNDEKETNCLIFNHTSIELHMGLNLLVIYSLIGSYRFKKEKYGNNENYLILKL